VGLSSAAKRSERYYFNFDPVRQQLYQLVQMAVSMALDLNLNRPVRLDPTAPPTLVPQLGLKARLLLEEIEGQRAILGCYYLSTRYVAVSPVILHS
jgi:hypothetical protein